MMQIWYCKDCKKNIERAELDKRKPRCAKCGQTEGVVLKEIRTK